MRASLTYTECAERGFRKQAAAEANVPTYRAKPSDGVAWITGASAGIGRALALRLAAEGWRVAATARRADALDALARASGGRITPYPGDVTDAAAMADIVAAIEAREGPIALAVLNAGVYHLAERERLDAALAWRTIETNLGGVVRCLDPLLATMVPRGAARSRLVASLAGYGGIPGSVAYGAGKAAVISMAEALRLTHARDGLTIQVVNPGFVRTAMTAPNDYPMPFMMSAEAAADRIASGLRRGGFEIAFPASLGLGGEGGGAPALPALARLMERATRRAKALKRETRAVRPALRAPIDRGSTRPPSPAPRSEPRRSSSGSARRSGRGPLRSSDGGPRGIPCSRSSRRSAARGSKRHGRRCPS